MKFSLFGRRVTVDFLFTALLAFLLFCDEKGAALAGLAAAFCHEMGHLVSMRLLRIPVKEFRFTPFGVAMVREESRQAGYLQDAIVSASGPLANLVLCGLCWMVGAGHTLFFQGNLLLALMNLLPVESFDGGQLLFSLFSSRFGVERAGRVVQWISFFILVPLAACSFLLLFRSRYNISLLLVTFYLAGLLLKQGRFF